jgi:hypothetical protein
MQVSLIDFLLAFCSSKAQRQLYIKLPVNIIKLLNDKKYSDRVLKLNRTLYGLPEASRSFHDMLNKSIVEFGFKNTIYEPCLYTLSNSKGKMAILLTVDDTRIGWTNQKQFDSLCTNFDVHPHLKPAIQPNPESYTGYRIERSSNGTVSISQPGYLKKLFEKYKINEISTSFQVPMDPKFNDDDQDDSKPYDMHAYQELIGELMYTLKSRNDCMYSVHRLASRTQFHTLKDYEAGIRVLCYLYHSRHLKLTLAPSSNFESIVAWADASHNSYRDSKSQVSWGIGTTNRNEHSVIVPFYVRSEKEDTVSTSPTEAETGAVYGAVKSVIAIREQLADMGFKQLKPTVIWCDNSALLSLTKTSMPNQQKRVKHFLLKINFIIDCIAKGFIELKQISSEENLADIWTKPLGKKDFHRHRIQVLGLHLVENTSLKGVNIEENQISSSSLGEAFTEYCE